MHIPRKIQVIAVLAILAGAGFLAWHLFGARQSGDLTLYGNVDIRQVDLGFRVGGRIAAVLVDEGDAVCEGLAAPQKGIILTRAREAGAIVQAGQTVYTLTLTNPVWLRAYVDEPNLGKVKPGMSVRVAVDAAPGKTFPGTVGFISPTAEFTPKTVETREVRTALVYRLRVQVEDPENVMRQGMPVTITLEPVTP